LTTFRAWAQLNLKGKEEWSEVFPEGKVPIKTMAAQKAKFGSCRDPESVFSVAWTELSISKQDALLEKLSQQNGLTKEMISEKLSKNGLAIGRSNFCCYGTLNSAFWV
jgi:hypothetical protein